MFITGVYLFYCTRKPLEPQEKDPSPNEIQYTPDKRSMMHLVLKT